MTDWATSMRVPTTVKSVDSVTGTAQSNRIMFPREDNDRAPVRSLVAFIKLSSTATSRWRAVGHGVGPENSIGGSAGPRGASRSRRAWPAAVGLGASDAGIVVAESARSACPAIVSEPRILIDIRIGTLHAVPLKPAPPPVSKNSTPRSRSLVMINSCNWFICPTPGPDLRWRFGNRVPRFNPPDTPVNRRRVAAICEGWVRIWR
ncbi:MAG: hypothetical protein RL345_2077 [Chloroflexota bacterium]